MADAYTLWQRCPYFLLSCLIFKLVCSVAQTLTRIVQVLRNFLQMLLYPKGVDNSCSELVVASERLSKNCLTPLGYMSICRKFALTCAKALGL